jgi:heme/copper-type cytochrome/quinol oxidase subunit 2
MTISRRTVAVALLGAGAFLLIGPSLVRVFAAGQDQAPPNRREFTLTAKEFHFTPGRIEVTKDDLVKLTVRSEDGPYSVTIDEYRISKRVPAGGTTTFEFLADRPGTFPFYSNLTSDSRHSQMRGELVVQAR